MAVYQSFPYNPSLLYATPLKPQAIHSSEFIKWSIHQSFSLSNFCAIELQYQFNLCQNCHWLANVLKIYLNRLGGFENTFVCLLN